MQNEVGVMMHQTAVGVALVYALQWVKSKPWMPWVNENSDKINRWLGIAIAVGTSAGIKWAVSAGENGVHHIAIDIPSFDDLLDTLAHSAAQFGGQQILYHTSVKRSV